MLGDLAGCQQDKKAAPSAKPTESGASSAAKKNAVNLTIWYENARKSAMLCRRSLTTFRRM
ncbi:hypothetical protein A7X67_00065 [Clostridium sp. W14A]|nr:hypothetical protein A7X67_00065 [Clostridium sp. W14A]